MKRVALIGRTHLIIETGKLLQSKGFEISLIITAKESPEYLAGVDEIENYSKRCNSVYINTVKINNETNLGIIKSLGQIDFCCSVNYPAIISQDVISLFKHGILNAHVGDLPKYRGNAVMAWAILRKEKSVALCVHKMVGGELDSGPIIERIYKEIDITTKIKELYDWFYEKTPQLFLIAIEKLLANSSYVLEYQSQNPADSLRCYPRLPEDGKINWSMQAEDIIRLINASGDPFSGAFTFLNAEELIIEDAVIFTCNENWAGIPGQVAQILSDGSVVVLCAQGNVKINRVRHPNQKETFKPSAIIKSTRQRFK